MKFDCNEGPHRMFSFGEGSMDKERIRILLIEDNCGDVNLVHEILADVTDADIELTRVSRLSDGIKRLKAGGIDIVLLDVSLHDAQGLDTVTQTHDAAPDVPIVVLTGYQNEELALNAVRQGVQDCLTKDQLPVQDYVTKARIPSRGLMRAMRHAIVRKRLENEKARLILELQEALASIKTLSRMLPICSCCKKIRDDSGYWSQVEAYIKSHLDVNFSHGICPECMQRWYGDYAKRA